MKKRILAMVVAAPCTLLKPKRPARIATIKKITAHVNIGSFLFLISYKMGEFLESFLGTVSYGLKNTITHALGSISE